MPDRTPQFCYQCGKDVIPIKKENTLCVCPNCGTWKFLMANNKQQKHIK